MSTLHALLHSLVGPLWLAVSAWALLAVVVAYFVIGPSLPGRGATPLAGARTPWLSEQHRIELEHYRQACVSGGRSLLWWRLVYSFTRTWHIVLAVGVLITVLALMP